MICPYRKKTIEVRTQETTDRLEIFADCHEFACPFYEFKKGSICRRAQMEMKESEKN